MNELTLDRNVVEAYWDARLTGSIPDLVRRFRYSDMSEVIEDIVRMREQSGIRFTISTPINLEGTDGAVEIFPRFSPDHRGGYLIFAENDEQSIKECWDIIPDRRTLNYPKNRPEILYGAPPSEEPYSFVLGRNLSQPIRGNNLMRLDLTARDKKSWVNYFWQAHLSTPHG